MGFSDAAHHHCAYCGGRARGYFSTTDLNRATDEQVFTYVRCEVCDLIGISAIPENLSKYYASDYHTIPRDISDLEPYIEAQKFKKVLIGKYKTGGHLLDIGASSGVFCEMAKRAGFEVSAIEMDPACCQFLREELRLRAVYETNDVVTTLRQAGKHYDVITLWHSIEHMPRPWEVLQAATESLSPGGILVIAAPNPNAWQAGIMGKRWPHWDAPRHLYLLSLKWLRQYLSQFPITEVEITTRDPGSLYWNRFGWGMFLKSFFKATGWRRWAWRLGVLGGWILSPLEGREGKGAAYTVIMRRKDD